MNKNDDLKQSTSRNTEYILNMKNQFEQMELKLPPTHDFNEMIETQVAMGDGVMLMTRIYFPEGGGPWPVILERSPYPQIQEVLDLTSKQFTKYGYVVVSQECRGKGASEGEWTPFENERIDGLDTINWIIEQTWMNGNMAMYGNSYGGFEQWILADSLPLEVKTLFVGVFGTERYRQMYMNGMFRHEIYTSWAIENSGVSITEDLGDVYQKAIKKRPHIDIDLEFFGEEFPWYRDWVSNVSKDSDFWQNGLWADLSQIPQKINVPMYIVGGWYDHHLDGTVCGYRQLSNKVKSESRFVIGPWIHSLQPRGDLEYFNSDYSSLKEAIEWFNHQLKGEKYPYSKGVVDTYVIRDHKWKSHQEWLNSNRKEKFYLSQDPIKQNGALCLEKEESRPEIIAYQYDPNNPVYTKGGEALLAWISPGFNGCPPSSVLQEKVGKRSDIISFISEPFAEDRTISGSIKVYLTVSTDVEDTSFTAKVSELFSDGNSYNIRDGITSITYRNGARKPQAYSPGEKIDLEIELWPITWTIKKGSQLRLDISSSNFPAYHVHPNVKGSWAEQKDTKIATQQIHIGKENHSYIEVPLDKSDI
ncbi:CocE/NonD family hydrolase [Metabacillus bambusae]|uniref:CocE/NonD family hydrolase n=1 Tax=Metabacillus bambusae TaxID=2795218 RepID=A0ABS3N6Z0_9BACI|nr:CocE/NonD family hydrolase [Metabacillus bambusae]MBO1514049.1 CocE/NonD family hydrolase [Metabacillus bambusae]